MHTSSPLPGIAAQLPPVEGERAAHTALADARHRGMQRLLALPLGAVAAIEAGWMAVCLVVAFLEVPLIETAIALILPAASDGQVLIGSAAYLLVYVTLWHVVGRRAAEARQHTLSTSAAGRAGRINPAFGVTGIALVTVLLGTLAAVAWRRASALADEAARAALNRATTEALTPLSAEQTRALSDSARQAALWPDLVFTVSVMAMLAALAIWIGYGAHTRHEALALHLARRRADRAARRAAALGSALADARRRADTQSVTAQDRRDHADRMHGALEHRFARARQITRHHFAHSQGTPEATSQLLPPQPKALDSGTPPSL